MPIYLSKIPDASKVDFTGIPNVKPIDPPTDLDEKKVLNSLVMSHIFKANPSETYDAHDIVMEKLKSQSSSDENIRQVLSTIENKNLELTRKREEGVTFTNIAKEAGKGIMESLLGIPESINTTFRYIGNKFSSDVVMKYAPVIAFRGSELIEGAISAVKGEKPKFYSWADWGADLAKLGKTGSNYWQKKAEYFHQPQEFTGKNLWDNPELMKEPEWWSHNLAGMAVYLGTSILPATTTAKMITQVGTSLKWMPHIIKNSSSLGAMLMGGAVGADLEASQTYKDVIDRTGSHNEAAIAAEGMFFSVFMLNAISTGKLLEKAAPGFKQKIIKHGVAAAVEGITEGAEEPAEVMSKIMARYLTGQPIPENVLGIFAESLKEAVTVMPLAAITGGGASAVLSTDGPVTKIDKDVSKEESAEKQSKKDLPLITEPKPFVQDKPVEKQGIVDESIYSKNRETRRDDIGTTISRSVKDAVKGAAQVADELLGVLSTRIGNISQEAKGALRKFEFESRQSIMADTEAVEPMLIKASKGMSRGDQLDFDLARKNADETKITELVKKYGIEKEYVSTRKVLDDIHKRAIGVGFDVGFLKNYHPRKIKDSQGLLNYFQRGDDWAIIDEAIKKKSESLGRYLTVEEKAQVANSVIRGDIRGTASPGSFKGRKIDIVDHELNKFYASSDAALLEYVRQANESIEARKFFGKGKGSKDFTNIDDSIGAYVIDLIVEGKIKPDQEKTLTKLLRARFNEKGPNKVISLYRDLSFIDTMASTISAITQIGDLTWALFKSGIEGTSTELWNSVRGKSKITKKDLGIERIAQEFDGATKTAKAVQFFFKTIGLDFIDKLGKETLVNATIKDYQKIAQNPDKVRGLVEEFTPIYGKETLQLITDLRNGEITRNVKLLASNTLLDFQPVALSEMTEKYLTSGNGRIFYMLKTFTIKQFDIFRREAFQKIKSGDPKQVAIGVRNLIKLAVIFVALNATADEIKDFLLGRKTEFSDRVIDNVLRLIGISKFIAWTGRREGHASAVLKQILPPVKFVDAVLKDARTMGDDKGFETVNSIPIFGKFYYWHFGKGSKKKKKTKGKRVR